MRVAIVDRLGLEFVELSGEAPPGGGAEAEARALFERFEAALVAHRLTLADTVRSRLFARDRAARDAASAVRSAVLAGPARAATSSYIAPRLFSSDAAVAMDLIALRSAPGLGKRVRENDPPRTPCRWIACGPLMVLSGQTVVLPSLADQVTTDILPRITAYLAEEGTGWDRVAQVSCYLHASETAAAMRDLFRRVVPAFPPLFEVRFVEGYSAEGKLVEIEVTALRAGLPGRTLLG
jgi:enamine deaminase RidA (YjgF/YER057c/UK114 family)